MQRSQRFTFLTLVLTSSGSECVISASREILTGTPSGIRNLAWFQEESRNPLKEKLFQAIG